MSGLFVIRHHTCHLFSYLLLFGLVIGCSYQAKKEPSVAPSALAPPVLAPLLVPTPPSSAPTSTPVEKKTMKGGKRRSEKDAEGTEAADRFEADTVIKSKYKLDGQSLEVDPD